MFNYQIIFRQRNLQKVVNENVLPIEDDDEEAENDMLTACIIIGMQNNR